MTVEAWARTPEYTIAGTGPYTIDHPYVADAICASVRLVDGSLVALSIADFGVAPLASPVTGNLTLTPAAAATHAGRKLVIDRVTPDEQGWQAVLGEREAGLMAQLDRMTQSIQEVRAEVLGAARIRGEFGPFDWADGTVPIRDGARIRSGPSATAIEAAASWAAEAAQSAQDAAASAAEALAKQNSMLRRRGPWVTATAYAPSDIVVVSGSAYICLVPHTSAAAFATDLDAGRWEDFVAKGDAGAGTGDMLKTENLSGLANVGIARSNLGLAAMSTKANVAFADLAAAMVRTGTETIALDETDEDELPTVKAVAQFVRGLILPAAPIASWDWSTNVNTIPLINLAGWDSVLVVGDLEMASGFLRLQVSNDNGSNWRTSGYAGRVGNPGGAGDFSNGFSLEVATTTHTRFEAVLQRMSASSRPTSMKAIGHRLSGALTDTYGIYGTPEVHNALRLVSSGFTAGFVDVFGLRRAAP